MTFDDTSPAHKSTPPLSVSRLQSNRNVDSNRRNRLERNRVESIFSKLDSTRLTFRLDSLFDSTQLTFRLDSTHFSAWLESVLNLSTALDGLKPNRIDHKPSPQAD